jgi:hypothetical protein
LTLPPHGLGPLGSGQTQAKTECTRILPQCGEPGTTACLGCSLSVCFREDSVMIPTKKLSGHGTRRMLPGRAADEVQVGVA